MKYFPSTKSLDIASPFSSVVNFSIHSLLSFSISKSTPDSFMVLSSLSCFIIFILPFFFSFLIFNSSVSFQFIFMFWSTPILYSSFVFVSLSVYFPVFNVAFAFPSLSVIICNIFAPDLSIISNSTPSKRVSLLSLSTLSIIRFPFLCLLVILLLMVLF